MGMTLPGKPRASRRPPVPTEAAVQASILAWLTLWKSVPIRVNSGAVKIGDRFVRMNSGKGTSDILCCLPGGKFAGIEVKRKGGKLQPHQRDFLDRVSACGGIALVVSSLDALRAALAAEGYDTGVGTKGATK